MAKTYRSFSEFWPFYLGEHRRPLTRALHVLGTGLGLLVLIGGLALGFWWALPIALTIGYAFAWAAHFLVEKNRPATFTYPWWSFLADWRLFALALSGRLSSELEKHQIR